ncbi:MAG: FHA domain-containing protein [Anaerolineales bacterium]
MASSSFRFVIKTGPNPGMVFELSKDVLLIGRDVTNDIVIGDAEISRQHARLTRTPGGHVLEDLGSTNGSFVKGERLMAPRVLNPGDLVGMGENVTMTFDATSSEAAATVASPADEPVAATPSPAGAAPLPAAVPAAAQPALEPEKKSRVGWVMAGGGCLVLVVACLAVFFIMDALYPEILYAPLRLFGFY